MEKITGNTHHFSHFVFRSNKSTPGFNFDVIISSAFFISYLSKLLKKKILILYFSLLAIIVGSLYAANLYHIRTNRIFSFIAERVREDTRTGVELYFYSDMKPIDWIKGRGVNGQYYCPNVDEDAVSNYRSVIETGYLQIILKGGLISLILLLLITIPAIFKGIFYSKNMLSKAAGIWIFLALISLYPATVDTFSMRYFLVWTSIGICYSKKIRDMPDNILREYFLEQKYFTIKSILSGNNENFHLQFTL